MSETKKHCDTCIHAYMEHECDGLRQKCRCPEYNASTYTHDMLMTFTGSPPESGEAIPAERGGRNGAGSVLANCHGRSGVKFLLTRVQNYCRFWTPKYRKDYDYEK